MTTVIIQHTRHGQDDSMENNLKNDLQLKLNLLLKVLGVEAEIISTFQICHESTIVKLA